MTVYPSGKSYCCAARLRVSRIDNMCTTRLPKRTTVYRVKPAMFYAGATNYVLQRSAGGRNSLGNLGYSSQVQCSLVPSPTPSFSLLAVRRLQYGKRRKAGRGTGNEATKNLKLQTVNDDNWLHRRPHPRPQLPYDHSENDYNLACSTSVCQASPTMPCILLVIM